jgi:hypothetical protein
MDTSRGHQHRCRYVTVCAVDRAWLKCTQALTGASSSSNVMVPPLHNSSFFEYALKFYVLTGESEFLDVWNEAYPAIMRYARSPNGFTVRFRPDVCAKLGN